MIEAETLSFFSLLRADMLAMNIEDTSLLSMLISLFVRINFLAVFLFRLSALCHPLGMIGRFFAGLLWRVNAILNGCEIRPDAKVGPGFNLPHPFGVVIGTVEIGRNVTILQNVTLGLSRSSGQNLGALSRPLIGDDVIIYAGAVLAGSIKVGKGARIGANAVVLNDVPDGHTAFMPPARLLPPKPQEADGSEKA